MVKFSIIEMLYTHTGWLSVTCFMTDGQPTSEYNCYKLHNFFIINKRKICFALLSMLAHCRHFKKIAFHESYYNCAEIVRYALFHTDIFRIKSNPCLRVSGVYATL